MIIKFKNVSHGITKVLISVWYILYSNSSFLGNFTNVSQHYLFNISLSIAFFILQNDSSFSITSKLLAQICLDKYETGHNIPLSKTRKQMRHQRNSHLVEGPVMEYFEALSS